MVRRLTLAAVILLMAGVTNAFAAVGGQTYDINITASAAGNLKAKMTFTDSPSPGDSGAVEIDIKNAADYSGVYTTFGLPTVITNFNVTSIAPSDGFLSSFHGTAIDFKQASGLVGALAQSLDLPGVTVGSGFSTSGDIFLFTGTEQ